jgi:xanthine/uracil permease
MMKEFFKANFLWIIGIPIGLITGYLYWNFYGCTESCAITSKPINSTLYGGLMGGLVFSLFKKEKK